MNCIPELTLESDRAFWVSRDLFEREFDQRDFRCRDSQEIDVNYSKHWIYEDSHGTLWFRVPTVHIVSGATQFINGRHRTAVLFGQIDRIPVAFAGGLAQDMASRLELEPVSMNGPIELPDLPIVDRPEF
jgi:hypothetical protein